MLRVRVIVSKNCKVCKVYLPRLDKVNYSYETYDGDAKENQRQLDEWKIVEFPVVQIVDADGNLLHQFPKGPLAPRAIDYKMAQLAKKR